MLQLRMLVAVVALAATALIATTGEAAEKERMLWKHSAGYFVKLKGERWQERGSKDEGKFNYTETNRTEEFVELYDKSREVTIRLRNNACMYKEKDGKFTKLYDGKWQD